MTELYERAFKGAVPPSGAYLKRIFFEPCASTSLPSLVYEDHDGRIVGCLGVMPRSMKFRGQAIQAAVAHHFIVDGSRKSALASVELARHFLRGPQDLSLAGVDESSRRIFEFVGGSVCLLYSLCWTRALRHAEYALAGLSGDGLPPSAALALKPLCRAVDAILDAVPRNAFRCPPPDLLADELDAATLHAALSVFSSSKSLHPVYDLSSLAWMIEVLNENRHRGSLHKVVLRTRSGRPLGWYLYHLGSERIAEVVQVGGRDDKMRDVLNHLFYHAWQRGAVAVRGPMDPSLCDVLAEEQCVFERSKKSWALIHSHDQEILNAINCGDAFLSRLEGGWWIAR